MVGEILNGTIDLNTCIGLVSTANQEVTTGMVASILILGFAGFVAVILFAVENKEKRLLKDYLRRQGLLNKYEDWKKDRRLGDD